MGWSCWVYCYSQDEWDTTLQSMRAGKKDCIWFWFSATIYCFQPSSGTKCQRRLQTSQLPTYIDPIQLLDPENSSSVGKRKAAGKKKIIVDLPSILLLPTIFFKFIIFKKANQVWCRAQNTLTEQPHSKLYMFFNAILNHEVTSMN